MENPEFQKKPEEEVKAAAAPPEDKITEEQIGALMEKLKSAGITDPKALEGKLRASMEAGNSARLLGNARNEIAELKELIKSLPAKTETSQNLDGFDSGETVNIETMLNNILDKRESKAAQKAREAQNQAWAVYNSITQDEDYPLVRDVWEKKLQDPNFILKVQSGQVNLGKEYQETLRKFFKGLLKQSHSTIQTLKSGTMPEPLPTETGGRTSSNLVQGNPKTKDERKKRIEELKAEVNKGYVLNEDEELELMGLI